MHRVTYRLVRGEKRLFKVTIIIEAVKKIRVSKEICEDEVSGIYIPWLTLALSQKLQITKTNKC